MYFVAADKRKRRRPIPVPDVGMPETVAHLIASKLMLAVNELQQANRKADTAAGAVERLVILEQVLDDLRELRSLITAWLVEDGMAEVPIQRIVEAIGRTGTTISRRYDEQHVRRLKTLE